MRAKINMEWFHMVQLILSLFTITTFGLTEDNKIDDESVEYPIGRYPLLMPKVKPNRPELYLCTPVRVDDSKSYYIVGYEPNATMNTAHHILLYGCGEPGSKHAVWDCGEMASSIKNEEERASPCGVATHSQILYAWARDAPKLELPEGVGFKVGKDSPIKFMVLQVHYAHTFAEEYRDDSGIFVHYTLRPLNKLAGVLLLGTAGVIPPLKTEHMETMCEISEHKTIYPIAYRTHTHGLGKVVAGYRVRPDKHGKDHWVELGKRDPLTPQMFYPVDNTEPIIYGDKLAARCTMESHRARYTQIGPTNEDEMCNFYLMYYVQNDEPLDMKYCFSQGPPFFYWKNADVELNNIPDYEASHM